MHLDVKALVKKSELLIVEDSPISQEMLATILAEAGYVVRCAADGKEALRLVATQKPDLILLDVVMPGMDGYKVCRHLKANTHTADIPVIFISAQGQTESKLEGFQAGGVDYILKPFEEQEVLARVRTHLEMHVLQHTLAAKNKQLQQEINERQQTQEALETREEQLRILIDAIPDVIIFKDAEDRWLETNAYHLKVLNKKRKEVLGCRGCDLEIPKGLLRETLQKARKRDGRAWRERHPIRDDEIMPDPHGAPRDMDVIRVPIFFSDGRPKYLIVVGRDVTEQRKAVNALQQDHDELERRVQARTRDLERTNQHLQTEIAERIRSEGQTLRRTNELATLNRVIATSVTGTEKETILSEICRELAMNFKQYTSMAVLFDADNKEASVVAEYRYSEAHGKTAQSGIRQPQTFQISESDVLQHLIENPEAMVIADITVTQDFSAHCQMLTPRNVRALMMVPLFVEGEPTGCLILMNTEVGEFSREQIQLVQSIADQLSGVLARLHLEDERRLLEDQYYQSQKMEAIGKLTGGVAHDINNILTVIIGVSDLLRLQKDIEPSVRSGIQQIQSAAGRAAGLVAQLLAYSRQQVLQPRVINLNEITQNFEAMLRHMIGEDIEFKVAADPELGLVKADPGQMEQVLMNLVVNARDAMIMGGKLTIETANVELSGEYARTHIDVSPGSYAMLAVSDSGTGMEPALLSRIFEPFFTTKTIGEGTGLGLSTVHGIVKQSGGHIWVYSEVGLGTTFKLYLPLVEAERSEQPEEEMPGTTLEGDETILVVEDEEIVRELVFDTLSNFGYTVLDADCGEAADRILGGNGHRVDLMVTDVIMPGGESGPQLAQRLIDQYPHLKVLYMSGYTANTIVQYGVPEDHADFIQKPFLPDELALKVRQLLDEDQPAP